MADGTTKGRLEHFYREHKDHVYNYVVRLTFDRDLALDVTQQTFLKALADPKLAGVEQPRAYLLTVARNTLYDEWKRKKEQRLSDDEHAALDELPDDPLEAPQAQAERQDMKDKIEHSISLMRPKFRELMLLRYSEDLSIEEIAAVTGRGISDVKVNLHRARLQFEADFTYLMYARVAPARRRCASLGELLAPYADQELPAEQIRVVDKHLADCAVCTDDMEEMKRSRQLFAALPLVPAPAVLDRLLASSLPGSGTTAPAVKTAVIKTTAMKIVASVVVVAVVGVGGYWLAHKKLTPLAPTVTTPVPPPTAPPAPPPSAPTAKPAAPVAKPKQAEASKDTAPVNKIAATPKTETGKSVMPLWNGPTFAARFVEKSRSGTRVALLYQSKIGTRQEFDDTKWVMIVNFKLGKGWLLNPVTKTYVEDTLDADGVGAEIFKDPKPTKPGGAVDFTTTLDWQPCEDFDTKQKVGEEVMLGRPTVKWLCGNTTAGTTVPQWYDPQLGLVIRDKSWGGTVGEVHDVRIGNLSDRLFQVPAGYRRVKTMAELMRDG
ncbi:MAG: sigma-70 family RNA polymerase sigma factor [Gammaproteobacteria bacterium]|nr:sigma-70 family RNA polymerase sigma factor [Gammaproteobacteria bacterium]